MNKTMRYNWLEFKPTFVQYRSKWIYNWFSNMETYPIVIEGLEYKSVENYYQSQKTLDPCIKEKIRLADPKKSKIIAREIPLRKDWDKIKLNIMKRAIIAKINTHENFRIKLIESEKPIIEWNNWNDKFWGVDYKSGLGLNMLGIILMQTIKT